MKRFFTLALAGFTPNLLYVQPDVKANTLPELLALAMVGELAYALSGNGTTTHLGAEALRRYVESEVGKWGQLVKDLNIKIQQIFRQQLNKDW